MLQPSEWWPPCAKSSPPGCGFGLGGAEDLDALAEILADREFTRFVGNGEPRGRRGTEEWLAAIHHHWTSQGFGLWAVTNRNNEELVGYCGLLRPGDDSFEIEVA